MSQYAGRGGGSAPSTGGGASIHPSGGGGGGAIHIPSGGGAIGGTVSRPQKTEVLNHTQQAAIGGPGAPTPHGGSPGGPHPGMPGGGQGPQIHPGIGGEHQQGGHDQGMRPPSGRDERAHPDQFRNFDPRFDHDRDRLGNSYWRVAFSDYDRDRFLPLIGDDPWLYQIFGINYYPEIAAQGISYYPTTCGPWNEGAWLIGTDSRWYPVHRHQLSIARHIESLRGIGGYEPVIIPNCGIGGGISYPYAPVATPYLI